MTLSQKLQVKCVSFTHQVIWKEKKKAFFLFFFLYIFILSLRKEVFLFCFKSTIAVKGAVPVIFVLFIAFVNSITFLSGRGAAAGTVSRGRDAAAQRNLPVILILSLGLPRRPFSSARANHREGPERPHHSPEPAGWPHQKPNGLQPSQERGRLLLPVLVPEPVVRFQR